MMKSIKQGDKFRKVYPFCRWIIECNEPFTNEHHSQEGWRAGCERHVEDGPAVFDDGQCIEEVFYNCDAEGVIEYEVLAVAKMPRKYQTRVLYRVTLIDPDGGVRSLSKCHTVTESKFISWLESEPSSYHAEYEVI